MEPVKVAIITIGDEILYGQTLDTNSHWMSQELDDHGFVVSHRATVGDNEADILPALDNATNNATIVLITGGLGPTTDDLTKPCLAKYFGVELVSNKGALEELTALFKHLDRELNEANIIQTNLPANADFISNAMGTAPGIWIENEGKIYVSMPGVPYEMKAMISNHVIPKLLSKYNIPGVEHKIIRTIGIGESWLSEKIKPWQDNLPEDIKLAYLPSLGNVKLRLTSAGNDKRAINQAFDEQIDKLKQYAEKYIYGYGEVEIEQVIGRILEAKGLTLATAESCTGGYLAHMITRIPGSSSYYQGSIISYANEIKEQELNVDAKILEEYGAVSEETVAAMAQGVCQKLGVDIGVATSGIAGPDGGTEDKPIGTIWLAVAYNGKVETRLLKLFKDRVLNIKLTAISALAMLWRILVKEPEKSS
jgi:nicotinamide-nucleotide amidase